MLDLFGRHTTLVQMLTIDQDTLEMISNFGDDKLTKMLEEAQSQISCMQLRRMPAHAARTGQYGQNNIAAIAQQKYNEGIAEQL